MYVPKEDGKMLSVLNYLFFWLALLLLLSRQVSISIDNRPDFHHVQAEKWIGSLTGLPMRRRESERPPSRCLPKDCLCFLSLSTLLLFGLLRHVEDGIFTHTINNNAKTNKKQSIIVWFEVWLTKRFIVVVITNFAF